jgi:hypothetical protein
MMQLHLVHIIVVVVVVVVVVFFFLLLFFFLAGTTVQCGRSPPPPRTHPSQLFSDLSVQLRGYILGFLPIFLR